MNQFSMDAPSYFVGLDLGQASDFSAVTVFEQTQRFPKNVVPDPEVTPKVNHYALRYLKRWQLGTSYPVIVEEVVKLCERPPLPGCSTSPIPASPTPPAPVNSPHTPSAPLPDPLQPRLHRI